ncbi:MAG: hypothetical protein HQL67_10335 [Magnetococcales bacterium]|nr:hypothetical protein [Magnetococcales bacterium]
MSELILSAPGPFDRYVAAHLSVSVLFRFQFIRDDGLTFSPDLDENITFSLYTLTGDFLLRGHSRRINPLQPLSFVEGVSGLVRRYAFVQDEYELELDQGILQAKFGVSGFDLSCQLLTYGAKIFETLHDRVYHLGRQPTPIYPGRHEIRLPFWHQTTELIHQSPTKASKTTTRYSSLPFRADLEIVEAEALARYHLPLLGIIWHPKSDLTGWNGTYDIRNICSGGGLTAAWQYPDGVEQPETLPASLLDRRYTLHEGVTLELTLNNCPGVNTEPWLTVLSDFGFSAQIPESPTMPEPGNIHVPISDFAANLQGQGFTVTAELHGGLSSFTYTTGDPTVYANLTATRIESPVINFDSFTFKPLPE